MKTKKQPEGRGVRAIKPREQRQLRAAGGDSRALREFTDPHGLPSLMILCSKAEADQIVDIYGMALVGPVMHESRPA